MPKDIKLQSSLMPSLAYIHNSLSTPTPMKYVLKQESSDIRPHLNCSIVDILFLTSAD